MAHTLPCPNPTCTHVFPPAEIKGASMLRCPKCGFEFQLRAQVSTATAPPSKPPRAIPAQAKPASPPPPQATARPAAAKPSPPPPAKPVAPPKAIPANPVPAQTKKGKKQEGIVSPVVRSSRNRGKSSFGLQQIALIGLGLGSVMAIVMVFVLTFGAIEEVDKGAGQATEDGTIVRVRIRNRNNNLERVCQLEFPEGEFTKRNREIQQRLNAVIVKERPPSSDDSIPPVWVGIAGKDYGVRKPRQALLVKEFDERVKSLFEAGTDEIQEHEPVPFEGVEAMRMEFKGRINAVLWRGMCYIFTKRGIGYLLFAAGPDYGPQENLGEQIIDGLQSRGFGFSFDTPQRSGWTPVQPKYVRFTHKKHPNVSLRAIEGVWRVERAEDEDERGIIYLYGEYGGKAIDNTKDATVMVLALEPVPDDKEAAIKGFEYIEGRKKAEEESNQLLPLEGTEKHGKRTDIGNQRGYLIEARLQRGRDTFRYLLIGVVNIEGKATYVIRCECNWKSRQIWRRDFIDLLKTFKVQT